MLLTAAEAYSAVNCFSDLKMLRSDSYKDHLLCNWNTYLRNSGRNLRPHLNSMSEQEACNLVSNIYAFWSRTPFGDPIGDKPAFITDTKQRCIEVGLIAPDTKDLSIEVHDE